jgi:hypothetical protein
MSRIALPWLLVLAPTLLCACRRPEPTITFLAMSRNRSCALTTHHELMCWGIAEMRTPSWKPWLRMTANAPDEVAFGAGYFCERLKAHVSCSSSDLQGTLELDTDQVRVSDSMLCANLAGTLRCVTEPETRRVLDAQAMGLVAEDVKDFAVGELTAVIRKTSGDVFVIRQGHPPALIPELRNASTLATNGVGVCGILAGGELHCNLQGLHSPKRIDGVRATLLVMGEGFACVRADNARVGCIGSVPGVNLGEGGAIDGLFGVNTLAASEHGVCAGLGITEGARCFGDNKGGTLGVPQTFVNVPMPVRFPR